MAKGIVRIQKKRSNYGILDRRFMEDVRLSWGAKGLLAYLLMKPDDWKVLITHLITQSSDGQAATRARLTELERCGYIRRRRIIDARSGRVRRWETIVFETPELADLAVAEQPTLFERFEPVKKPRFQRNTPEVDFPHLDSPHVENPDVDSPHVENRTLLRIEQTKDGETKERQTGVAEAARAEAVVVSALVAEGFTHSDSLLLVSEFGAEPIRHAIRYTAEQAARRRAGGGRIHNRRAYLVTALKRGFSMQTTGETASDGSATRAADSANNPDEIVRAARDRQVAEAAERERLKQEDSARDRELDALTSDRWRSLLEAVLPRLNPWLRARIERGELDPTQSLIVRIAAHEQLQREGAAPLAPSEASEARQACAVGT